MSPEEAELFREYVKGRREMYSWKQFWLVMSPVLIGLMFVIAFVVSLVKGA